MQSFFLDDYNMIRWNVQVRFLRIKKLVLLQVHSVYIIWDTCDIRMYFNHHLLNFSIFRETSGFCAWMSRLPVMNRRGKLWTYFLVDWSLPMQTRGKVTNFPSTARMHIITLSGASIEVPVKFLVAIFPLPLFTWTITQRATFPFVGWINKILFLFCVWLLLFPALKADISSLSLFPLPFVRNRTKWKVEWKESKMTSEWSQSTFIHWFFSKEYNKILWFMCVGR